MYPRNPINHSSDSCFPIPGSGFSRDTIRIFLLSIIVNPYQDGELNQSVAWNSPEPNIRRTDRPNGTPPPVYSSKRDRRKKGKEYRRKKNNRPTERRNAGLENPAFYASSATLPQTHFGPPQQSQWIWYWDQLDFQIMNLSESFLFLIYSKAVELFWFQINCQPQNVVVRLALPSAAANKWRDFMKILLYDWLHLKVRLNGQRGHLKYITVP